MDFSKVIGLRKLNSLRTREWSEQLAAKGASVLLCVGVTDNPSELPHPIVCCPDEANLEHIAALLFQAAEYVRVIARRRRAAKGG